MYILISESLASEEASPFSGGGDNCWKWKCDSDGNRYAYYACTKTNTFGGFGGIDIIPY